MGTDQPNDASGDDQRNNLALVRTDLANERTLLAYGRTALMLAATGITVLKFFPELPHVMKYAVGIIGFGALVALAGVVRFTTLRKRLRQD